MAVSQTGIPLGWFHVQILTNKIYQDLSNEYYNNFIIQKLIIKFNMKGQIKKSSLFLKGSNTCTISLLIRM